MKPSFDLSDIVIRHLSEEDYARIAPQFGIPPRFAYISPITSESINADRFGELIAFPFWNNHHELLSSFLETGHVHAVSFPKHPLILNDGRISHIERPKSGAKRIKFYGQDAIDLHFTLAEFANALDRGDNYLIIELKEQPGSKKKERASLSFLRTGGEILPRQIVISYKVRNWISYEGFPDTPFTTMNAITKYPRNPFYRSLHQRAYPISSQYYSPSCLSSALAA